MRRKTVLSQGYKLQLNSPHATLSIMDSGDQGPVDRRGHSVSPASALVTKADAELVRFSP